MAYEKTPKRTLRWANCCMFVEREVSRLATTMNAREHDQLHAQLVDYVTRQEQMASFEGYDDTAQYMQHVLDDLKN